MAGKRKIIRQRTNGKKRTKGNGTETKDPSKDKDSILGFTKEEEEEPLSIHIKPSPKKSPRRRSPKKSPRSRSPKQSPRTTSRRNTKRKNNPIVDNEDDPANDDGKEDATQADNDEDENGNGDGEEERKNKFDVRQRVLARDEDGILYCANIRRVMFGINHQKSISCLGIFDIAPETLVEKNTSEKGTDKKEDGEKNDDKSQPSNQDDVHYFVHYEGWKALWDRWVPESDILEMNPENLERMKEISKAHKAFQAEFKEKTKKRKIQNGGLFVHQWKQRLDALNHRWDEKLRVKTTDDKGKGKPKKKRKAAAKKKNNRSPQEILRDRSKLVVQSCLTIRQPSHIQAIPLSFALKRILVEDWENLNNNNFGGDNSKDEASDDNLKCDSMVHVLPAKVTIRDALSLYLKEKGIDWDGKPKQKSSTNLNGGKENSTNESPIKSDATSRPDQEETKTSTESSPSGSSPLPDETISVKEEKKIVVKNDPDVDSNSNSGVNEEKKVVVKDDPDVDSKNSSGDDENGKGVSIQLEKEWTDMVEGIVLYFEQALMARLLYPSEISQILVLEDTMMDDSVGETSNKIEAMPLKVDIYGCEHLLRLLSAIPRILDQQLQDSRKRKLERNQKSSTSKTETDTDGNDSVDQEDAFVEIGGMILAKLQDLSRFLQKNQSTLFRSMYRKKNEQEIKRDIKIQKRQEKRLKHAAAVAHQKKAQSSQEQEGGETESE